MYGDELPEFQKGNPQKAKQFAASVFKGSLLDVIAYDDGHYRAVFKSTFFTLHDDADAPTKSQWSTLKKRMKRRNRQTFIFKEQGELDCDMLYGEAERNYACYYVDFGFFKE